MSLSAGNTRVAVNTLSQVASRGLVILGSLLTTALLTRMLGSFGYGDYVFITSFILIFVGLSDFGLTTIGVREASAKKEKASETFGQILTFRLIIAVLLLVFFNLLVYCLPQFAELRAATAIGSMVIFFLAFRTTAQAVLQTFLRLDLASLLEVSASALFLFPLVFFWLADKAISLTFLMNLWVVSALISSVLGLALSSRFLRIKISFSFTKISSLLKESVPLGVYLLVYSVYDRGIDSFLIKTFTNSQAVGYYGLAYKIHGNLVLGAAFLMNSLFPLLSSFKSSLPVLKKTAEKAFTVLFLTGLVVSTVFFIFAPLVIKIISGPEFSPSVLTLRILVPATFFSYLNHLTGYLLVVLGKQKKLLQFSLGAFLVNFVCNMIFIPIFSFYAAAAVTMLTELVLLVLTKHYLSKNLGLKFSFRSLRKNFPLLLLRKEKFFDKY